MHNQSYLKLGVSTYRELLLRLKTQQRVSVEDRASALHQAKQRALVSWRLRLHGRTRPLLDPKGAFNRLKGKARSTSDRIRMYGREALQRYRAAYQEALTGRPIASLQQQATSRVDGLTLSDNVQQSLTVDVTHSHPALRALVIAAVGAVSHGFMHALSNTTVHNAHHLDEAMHRPPGQALITVSNHVAALDDPLVTAALLPVSTFMRPSSVRWTLCATDRCFKNDWMGAFFRAGQVLPVERGAGLAQPGVQAAEQLLQQGQWVHIFPEGTRSRDGRLGPSRKGVGRLVAACSTPPLVLPFVHKGMDGVMKKGAMLPRMGQQVQVAVGEPVPMVDLLEAAQTEGWTDEVLYKQVADRVSGALQALYTQLNPADAPLQHSDDTVDDAFLMPLIEDELDSMGWLQRRRQQWTDRWRDTWRDSAITWFTWATHMPPAATSSSAAAAADAALLHLPACTTGIVSDAPISPLSPVGAGMPETSLPSAGSDLQRASLRPPVFSEFSSVQGVRWRSIIRTPSKRQLDREVAEEGVLAPMWGSQCKQRDQQHVKASWAENCQQASPLTMFRLAESKLGKLGPALQAAVDYCNLRCQHVVSLQSA